MNEHEATANEHESAPTHANGKRRRRQRAPSRAIRPRSAVTSGRQLFISGNPNSAWSRRFDDLLHCHISDISAGRGADVLSAAQLTSLRQAAAIEVELERLQARLSRGEEVNLEAFARTAGHLRRMWETLGMARQQKPVMDLDTYLAAKKAKAKEKDITAISDGP